MLVFFRILSPTNQYILTHLNLLEWFQHSCGFILHYTLQSLKVKVKSLSCVWLFATPWTVAYKPPPSMGFSRQEYWSGLPFPSPRDLPDSGIRPGSPALQTYALISEPPQHRYLLPTWELYIQKLTRYLHLHDVWAPWLNQFSSVAQSCPTLMTTWPATHQASLSITNSQGLLKLMSIEAVMPSNHLILCRPLLLLPPIFPSIRVFSKESVLHIRWPKDWSFSFSISPSNEYSGLISFRIDQLDLLAVQGTLKSLLNTPQFKSINYSELSFLYGPTLTSIPDYWKNHSFD